MADAYGDFNTTLGSGSSNNHSLEGSQRSRVDSLQMLGFPSYSGSWGEELWRRGRPCTWQTKESQCTMWQTFLSPTNTTGR